MTNTRTFESLMTSGLLTNDLSRLPVATCPRRTSGPSFVPMSCIPPRQWEGETTRFKKPLRSASSRKFNVGLQKSYESTMKRLCKAKVTEGESSPKQDTGLRFNFTQVLPQELLGLIAEFSEPVDRVALMFSCKSAFVALFDNYDHRYTQEPRERLIAAASPKMACWLLVPMCSVMRKIMGSSTAFWEIVAPNHVAPISYPALLFYVEEEKRPIYPWTASTNRSLAIFRRILECLEMSRKIWGSATQARCLIDWFCYGASAGAPIPLLTAIGQEIPVAAARQDVSVLFTAAIRSRLESVGTIVLWLANYLGGISYPLYQKLQAVAIKSAEVRLKLVNLGYLTHLQRFVLANNKP